MIKKRSALLVCTIFTVLIMLTGCFGPSPEEKIFDILEKSADKEEIFKEQQQPLADLEQKESKLYDEIVSLGMEEHDKIVSKSKEALKLVGEREERLAKEHESMKASKEESGNLKTEIAAIEEDNVKKSAEKVRDVVEKRYASYEKIYKDYEKAITYDKELYTMLQKKDLKIEDLEAQINKNNEIYKQILTGNDEFNKLTEEYNDLKLKFYKAADIEVEQMEE
ncbi:YkyA family protein [Metabacillus fastidiosus]|uniref:YkyA family protein n=1 Tax=Metabacillus fastidiosus TaxID=1458 RepID=UPI002E21C33C|nr:YkyA family protein [Metabacillus fastidiosus]